MQTACGEEIDNGAEYFGVQPGNDEEVSRLAQQDDEIKRYLEQAPKPNPACCTAAMEFNE